MSGCLVRLHVSIHALKGFVHPARMVSGHVRLSQRLCHRHGPLARFGRAEIHASVGRHDACSGMLGEPITRSAQPS